MLLPFHDNNFFTQGVDYGIMQNVPFYSFEEYESVFLSLLSSSPELISINLRDAILKLSTSYSPTFTVSTHEIIDIACQYYADYDSINAVTDEFVNDQLIASLKLHLKALYQQATNEEIEKQIQLEIDMFSESVKEFMAVIVGALSRYNVPIVEDFGSVYRLTNIDEFGNVFFQLAAPNEIHSVLEQNKKSYSFT